MSMMKGRVSRPAFLFATRLHSVAMLAPQRRRSVAMVRRYIHRGQLWADNAAGCLGL